jgi:hypothetical protein
MKGRRLAALLCVLLAHALLIYLMMGLRGAERRSAATDFVSEPITLYLPLPPPEPAAPPPGVAGAPAVRAPASPPVPAPSESAATESSAITLPGRVDWPLEGQRAAARELAREAEAERIAKMFAGPGGTWASLTKRQQSKLNKFRWKPGVAGLEYDSQGNQIYHISEGCVIVNSLVFGCTLGKPKVHDDMFENMRLYFDEQRLPETREGNGTEPEARRPPN